MKDDAPTVISIPSSTSSTAATTTLSKKDSSDLGPFSKIKYKFWVFTAILLLAFWSMFTGSVTLKWSTGHLSHISDDLGSPILDEDLDILEVEEKEKTVKHMWDIYTHSSSSKLPRFWREAFEAAYEALVSDVSGVRDAAVSEIAKMSLIRSFNTDPLPLHSTTPNSSQGKKRLMLGNSIPASGNA